MKASELIHQLKRLIDKHGDKDVFADGYKIFNVDYDVDDDSFDINT